MSVEDKLRQLDALQEIPDYLLFFLRVLPVAARLVEQVPERERTSSTLIDILDGLLLPKGDVDEKAKEVLNQHRAPLQAMMLILRGNENDPVTSFFDPPEGPAH